MGFVITPLWDTFGFKIDSLSYEKWNCPSFLQLSEGEPTREALHSFLDIHNDVRIIIIFLWFPLWRGPYAGIYFTVGGVWKIIAFVRNSLTASTEYEPPHKGPRNSGLLHWICLSLLWKQQLTGISKELVSYVFWSRRGCWAHFTTLPRCLEPLELVFQKNRLLLDNA